MKPFKRKLAVPFAACIALLCCFPTTAFAYSSESETVTSETEAAPLEEPAIDRSTATEEGNPFTTDGNGQLQDQADSSQNKIFYTITTKNNNTYFLVIDKDRSSNNVYMLSMIDDADLAEFTEEGSAAAEQDSLLTEEEPLMTEPDSSGDGDETLPAEEEPSSSETEAPAVEEEPKSTEKNTVSPILILLIALLAVGVVAGYYVLKIRPKKELEEEEDETAYGGEEEADDAEDTEEPDDTEETEASDSLLLPHYEEHTAESRPFEDYPNPEDYPDPEYPDTKK